MTKTQRRRHQPRSAGHNNMDPNQNAQVPQQPVQPVQQVSQPIPVATSTPTKSSHKTFFIVLVAGSFLILFLAGAFYLFMQQQTNQYAASTKRPSEQIVSSPTQTADSQEEQDVLNIDVGNVENDLQDLDKDLKQL